MAQPKSLYVGVVWHVAKQKWLGKVNDPLQKTASGGQKHLYTKAYEDQEECALALAALREKVKQKYIYQTMLLALKDPELEGIRMGPVDPCLAEVGKAYWRPNRHNNHIPFKVRRSGTKRVQWVAYDKQTKTKNPP